MKLSALPARIKHSIRWRSALLGDRIAPWLALAKIRIRTALPPRPKPHGLPGELIVSLTSYPPRFPTLMPTLRCLLSQSMKPDRVILWLSHGDTALLPQEIRDLRNEGLEIRETNNLGSYNKIIPTLRAFPAAFIVTSDDDLYYSSTWLEDLVKSWDRTPRQIVCHRAHVIKCDKATGLPLPYREWGLEKAAPGDTAGIFPTSGAGILYPPGCFGPDVMDEDTLKTICPSADDIWLYWMGLKGGSQYKKAGGCHKLVMWPGSQVVSLVELNFHGNQNDIKIKNMIERYGWPAA